MTGQPAHERLTLASKLDQLFRTAHPRARGEYTYDEVAVGINARGGETISPAYLHELRTGKKDNPRKRHLEVIAEFFDVPASYLLEEGETAAQIHAELQLLAAMRDSNIRGLAAHAAKLSPRALQAITEMTKRLHELENTPDQSQGGSPSRTKPDGDQQGS